MYVIRHKLLAILALTTRQFRSTLWRMSEKPMTVVEMARMGGLARAKGHTKAELRKWGKEGGRPVSLNRKGLARLEALLRKGKSQAECAKALRVSARTIGQVVARIRASDNPF